MLKVEIVLDEKKLEQTGYILEQAEREIRNYFGKYPKDIQEITTTPKTLVFKGLDTKDSWADLMICISHFLEKTAWFQKSVVKVLFYDSDEGINEEDFEVEDVVSEFRRLGKLK